MTVAQLDPSNQVFWQTRARILKAMAHPTRLFLLDVLSRGEHSVGELTGMVGADMSTVSRHLARLRRVGLLYDERRGNQVVYRLAVPCALDFFSCVEGVLAARGEARSSTGDRG